MCFFEKIQIRTLESKDGSSVTLGKTENPKMDFEHKAMPERIPQIKSEPEFTGLLIRAFLWLLIWKKKPTLEVAGNWLANFFTLLHYFKQIGFFQNVVHYIDQRLIGGDCFYTPQLTRITCRSRLPCDGWWVLLLALRRLVSCIFAFDS